MQLKIEKIKPEAKLPNYAHIGDAGMDLFACEEVALAPGERRLVPIGIKLEIPEGFVGLVWDKSGLATNHGLSTIAGVIDSGYRGELKVALINLSQETYTFAIGDKVAQLLIQPVSQCDIVETEIEAGTSRSEGGFGSTGK